MNRYIFELGNIKIYWYSVLILSSVLIGIYLVDREIKKVNINNKYINDLIYYLVIVAIIGARLYYVIFNFDSYKGNFLSILYIWEGGMAIYGSVLASLLFLYYYSKKHKQSMFLTTDVLVPSLILGQAIGRWGNFFNQEAYGPVTTYSFLKGLHIPNFIINGMYINNNYYHPTFLYESLWCFLGFIILIIIRKYYKKLKIGQLTFFYFTWYGFGRFFIEGLRQDSLYFMNIRISQLVSLLLIITGILGTIINYRNLLYYNGGENEKRI